MTDASGSDFFDRLPMRRVLEAGLDTVLADHARVRILFLWGRDCPNCDVAKGQMLLTPERFDWPDVDWPHDNVYEDPGMGVRLGLHGIPAFVVFSGARRIGRITPWPGADAFVAAIEAQRESAAG